MTPRKPFIDLGLGIFWLLFAAGALFGLIGRHQLPAVRWMMVAGGILGFVLLFWRYRKSRAAQE